MDHEIVPQRHRNYSYLYGISLVQPLQSLQLFSLSVSWIKKRENIHPVLSSAITIKLGNCSFFDDFNEQLSEFFKFLNRHTLTLCMNFFISYTKVDCRNAKPVENICIA